MVRKAHLASAGRGVAVGAPLGQVEVGQRAAGELGETHAAVTSHAAARDAARGHLLGAHPRNLGERVFIAIPKINGYQALHTSLLALNAFPIEVQIQTRSMWATANMGIAAHWSYKTNDGARGPELRASKWLSGLIDLQKKSTSSIEFTEAIKKDLEPNEVYLFSPKGHVYAIKTGATPIDFAYEVHTGLGNSIVGCKVNKREAPLNVELESGQTVEIITSDYPVDADPAWLNFVVTSKARSGIRSRLRNQKNSSARKAGKLMLESELKRSGKSLEDYRYIASVTGCSTCNRVFISMK